MPMTAMPASSGPGAKDGVRKFPVSLKMGPEGPREGAH